MPSTRRLYYEDSHLIEFEAQVIDHTERVSGWTAVTLDQTAFYPTGGGQPSDTGTLDGKPVVECIDNEDEGVLHIVKGRAPEIGSLVKGRVDWARRLDHMQQHTGQHILSQSFVTLFNAPTRSFRVLDDSCEIDVDLPNTSAEVIERAVELANNVVWEDRVIRIRNVTSEEAAQLPVRKDPAREGELRLIEIEGFDLTPCGGTHAYRTGEVGMIGVRSWERAKGLTRIEFVAGTRALADYRRANKTARAVAALYSAARDDAAKLTSRVLEENKELHRRLHALEAIAARVEAEALIRDAGNDVIERATTGDNTRGSSPTVREGARSSPTVREGARSSPTVREDSRGSSNTEPGAVATGSGARSSPNVRDGSCGSSNTEPGAVATGSGAHSSPNVRDGSCGSRNTEPGAVATGSGAQLHARIITKVFDNRDAESIKHLAQALIAHPGVVALLGSRDGDTARLVFARSTDTDGDMNALMREACAMLDGRGGGKADMAQGGGRNVDRLNEALETVARILGGQ